jgi:RNA polymerase sigma factor FliA
MNTVLQHPPVATRVEEFLDVVDAALAPLARRLPATVSRDDLASSGRLALVETLADFEGPVDEARAYAFTRVRGAMLDELRRLDPLSRRTRARVTAVRRAAADLAQEFGRAATVVEVAEAAGLSAGEVRRAEQIALAAEVYVNEAGGTDVFSHFADEQAVSPVAFAESGELVELVREALERLPPKQAFVLRRYHLEDATLEEIAGEIGVSKERVRQIREAGEGRLRADYSVLALWQALIEQRRR